MKSGAGYPQWYSLLGFEKTMQVLDVEKEMLAKLNHLQLQKSRVKKQMKNLKCLIDSVVYSIVKRHLI
jgi:hypothetical protein